MDESQLIINKKILEYGFNPSMAKNPKRGCMTFSSMLPYAKSLRMKEEEEEEGMNATCKNY